MVLYCVLQCNTKKKKKKIIYKTLEIWILVDRLWSILVCRKVFWCINLEMDYLSCLVLVVSVSIEKMFYSNSWSSCSREIHLGFLGASASSLTSMNLGA